VVAGRAFSDDRSGELTRPSASVTLLGVSVTLSSIAMTVPGRD
jgi:hypothetical protein